MLVDLDTLEVLRAMSTSVEELQRLIHADRPVIVLAEEFRIRPNTPIKAEAAVAAGVIKLLEQAAKEVGAEIKQPCPSRRAGWTKKRAEELMRCKTWDRHQGDALIHVVVHLLDDARLLERLKQQLLDRRQKHEKC